MRHTYDTYIEKSVLVKKVLTVQGGSNYNELIDKKNVMLIYQKVRAFK